MLSEGLVDVVLVGVDSISARNTNIKISLYVTIVIKPPFYYRQEANRLRWLIQSYTLTVKRKCPIRSIIKTTR